MLIRVDPLREEPIFEQIAFAVKGAVARGELVAGDRLPSVRELAKTVSVNPNTVVKAFDSLESDGVIVRRQGTGCFVSPKASALSDTERTDRLGTLAERTVTEAFHLGFTAADIRDAIGRALKEIRFGSGGKK